MTTREKVLSAANEYFQEKFGKEHPFIPGKSYIPASAKSLDESDLQALINASLDMWLTSGRHSQEFESRLAKTLERRYALFVNSGSSANLLAYATLTSDQLRDRSLKPGDEVITAAAGFPTTVTPAMIYGACPVFVDIDPETLNVSAESVAAAITKKTKVVALAHTLGNPFEAEKIRNICESNQLWLIEDNCDGLGSVHNKRPTGSFGHLATQSFYPAHHITTGEGGAMTCDSSRLHTLALRFRDWGRDCYCEPGHDNTCGKRFCQKFPLLPYGYDHKYVYSELGFNLKATDMQAAIGCSQLSRIESFTAARRFNYLYLQNALSDLQQYVTIQKATSGSSPSWFGFAITLLHGGSDLRLKMQTILEAKGIGTRLLFGGNLIRQPAFAGKHYRVHNELAHTDNAVDRTFWVACHHALDKERLAYLAEELSSSIRAVCGGGSRLTKSVRSEKICHIES